MSLVRLAGLLRMAPFSAALLLALEPALPRRHSEPGEPLWVQQVREADRRARYLVHKDRAETKVHGGSSALAMLRASDEGAVAQ